MENLFAKAEQLADNVKEYINNRIRLMKLSVAEKSSSLIANIAAAIIAAVFLVFFLLLASVALSLVLGTWIGKLWAGFLIVAGVYLLIGIIIWKGRRSIIQQPVMNSIIQQLFKSDEKDK